MSAAAAQVVELTSRPKDFLTQPVSQNMEFPDDFTMPKYRLRYHDWWQVPLAVDQPRCVIENRRTTPPHHATDPREIYVTIRAHEDLFPLKAVQDDDDAVEEKKEENGVAKGADEEKVESMKVDNKFEANDTFNCGSCGSEHNCLEEFDWQYNKHLFSYTIVTVVKELKLDGNISLAAVTRLNSRCLYYRCGI